MFGELNTSQKSGFLPHSPVSRFLIISCLAIFLIEFFFQITPFTRYGFLSYHELVSNFQLWRLLSFQFLHADFRHILGNLLGLYFFAPVLEQWLGSKRFTVYYLICGISGGLVFILATYWGWIPPNRLVGASAGLYGLFIALFILRPHTKVHLFFLPIAISIRWVVIGLLVFAGLSIFITGVNAGGEYSHLGGALMGYILLKNPQALNFLTSFFLNQPFGVQKNQRKHSASGLENYEPKIKPRVEIKRANTPEIDRILDKISAEGLHSITDEEREILNQFSKSK